MATLPRIDDQDRWSNTEEVKFKETRFRNISFIDDNKFYASIEAVASEIEENSEEYEKMYGHNEDTYETIPGDVTKTDEKMNVEATAKDNCYYYT